MSVMFQGCDLQRGSIYLIKSGLTMRHLSLADRATPLLGPEGRLPSSLTSSSSVANGIYGSELVDIGELEMSS